MPEPETNPPIRLSFGRITLYSTLLYTLAITLERSLRQSAHLEGLATGLIYAIVTAPFFLLIYHLPWSGIVFLLYRWRRWNRFRSQWSLLPGTLAFAATLLFLTTTPPTPHARFKAVTGSELPTEIHNLHYRWEGGGFADHQITYYFETTTTELDRIAKNLGFRGTGNKITAAGANLIEKQRIRPLPGCPDYASWPSWFVYSSDKNSWYYTMITDPTSTRAYISITSI